MGSEPPAAIIDTEMEVMTINRDNRVDSVIELAKDDKGVIIDHASMGGLTISVVGLSHQTEDLIIQNILTANNLFHLQVTQEEYHQLRASGNLSINNGVITHSIIDGDMRLPWLHLTMDHTWQASMMQLAWLISAQKVMTSSLNVWYSIIFELPPSLVTSLKADGIITSFHRHFLVPSIQLGSGHRLDILDRPSKVYVCRINGDLTAPFQRITWRKGGCWAFNIPISLHDLERPTLAAAASDLFRHVGTSLLLSTEDVPASLRDKYIDEASRRGIPLIKCQLNLERIRGSRFHAQHLQEATERPSVRARHQ